MTMDNDHSHIEIRRVPAGEFKARCLKLMDEVRAQGVEIVITKRGAAVARLVPVAEDPRPVLGAMKGTAIIRGDLTAPLEGAWEAHGVRSGDRGGDRGGEAR
jgi:prevent-host-death family protein